MPVPMSEQGNYVAPIARRMVELGFHDSPIRSGPYKDIRNTNVFPVYAGQNVSGIQLMGFAGTMKQGFNVAGTPKVTQGTVGQVQLGSPQAAGGGPAYVARLRAMQPQKAPVTLAQRIRRLFK